MGDDHLKGHSQIILQILICSMSIRSDSHHWLKALAVITKEESIFRKHLLQIFYKKLLQQHVGHLFQTTNAEGYIVNAINETWTHKYWWITNMSRCSNFDRDTCITRSWELLEFLSLFLKFHKNSGYEM